MAQTVEVEVDHRSGVEGQHLAQHQTTDDGDTQWLTHLRTFGTAQHQRQGAKDGSQGGHHDRPETQQARLADGLLRTQALTALQLQGQINHQDGVLLDDTDQQEQTQQGDQTELHAYQLQREQGANAGRRQGRKDGQRMYVALVEHAQHDIHHHQCQQDHQRLIALGLLEGCTGAAQHALHFGGQADPRHGIVNGAAGLIQADPFGQGEADVLGGELALVVDPVLFQAAFPMGEGGQRHPCAIGGDQLNLVQRLGMLGIERVDFHHHAVLVQRFVDGGNLALTEGVVEHCGDHAHLHAQALRGFAIHHQANLLGTAVLAGVDIGQFGQRAQRFTHLG